MTRFDELCQRGDRSIGQIARNFDLTDTAVREWVKQAERDTGTRTGGLCACRKPRPYRPCVGCQYARTARPRQVRVPRHHRCGVQIRADWKRRPSAGEQRGEQMGSKHAR
ncbi:hypothetical protein KUTG_02394 [Kutzneria sp. 744]|nr:hypothetical protein KUTG_02394 [Kutzneria sp. 744]